MATKDIAIEIRENVLTFFNKNIEKCLSAFIEAEDPELSNIYTSKQIDFINLIKNADILILTANKYETNILHKSINNISQRKIVKCTYQVNHIDYNVFFFHWGQYYCAHVMASSTGSNTINGSEDMVRMMFAIKEFNPLVVLSFGICFGINHSKQNLCDVIISDKVYSYGVGIKIRDSKVIISDDNNFQISENLKNKIKELYRENSLSTRNGEFFRHYITGEVVVSNEEFKQAIIQQIGIDRGILAGEMEGYGIFKECKKYGKTGDGSQPVSCIIVKSICDWGAEKNDFFAKSDGNSTDYELENMPSIDHQKLYESIAQVYKQKDTVLPKSIKSSKAMEELIKDSIQAFAAQCAFDTCNKIVVSSSMVFGMTPYCYICDVLQNLKDEGDCIIEAINLKNYIKKDAPRLTDNDIDDIISELIQEGKISTKDNKGFHAII